MPETKGLQQVYKNMNLLVDGHSMAGQVDSLTPPKLEVITTDYRGGGMDQAVQVDMGLQPLTAEFSMNDYSPTVWRAFGIGEGQKTTFAFRGAVQQINGIEAVRVEFLFTGAIFSIDAGELKAGQESKPKFSISSIDHYKYSRDGELIHEIDVINRRRVINGVDQLAKINEALGTGGNFNMNGLTVSPRTQSRRNQADQALNALSLS